jgi:5-oxoprolinase (ATP-hydrolysing)
VLDGAGWRFAIDVGGTFTDVLAYGPDGAPHVVKVLSSGRVRGVVGEGSAAAMICDAARRGETADLWAGYWLQLLGGDAEPVRVAASDARTGRLRLDGALPVAPAAGAGYELFSDEPAPVVAIRLILGRRLDEPIGAVDVRLGSTRGTNALLERKGAPTAFVTTAGFEDLPLIGYQDRPRLFDLNIRKPASPATYFAGVEARLAADGTELRAVDAAQIEGALRRVREAGAQTAAVCLLHACKNDAHERVVADVAGRLGFEHVSVSSVVAPTPRLIPRADTTIVDAYLSPVIRGYVQRLRECLPHARLRLMTSAGGLVDAGAFIAKDSVLSGPAGGVVGCATVAEQAGFARAIGFDMGGTSTDVSRYDGRFEYQYEAEKAGIRVVAPMLAVETVAAGGGSICRFDGQRLVVGPDSAGADPGPVCYGRGGPLAVTDVNLFLGRVLADRFPFPLDRAAVARRLEAMAGEVAAATGKRLEPMELAEGFVAIANANMAAAIKKISIARGYDVRDTVLVAFGGAGGQHACGVADPLGMDTILIAPDAGVLSAVGMAHADVTRHADRPVLRRYEDVGAGERDRLFAEMEAPLRAEIRAEGIANGAIRPPRRALDLRYVGQNDALTVEADASGDYRGPFEAAHERLYGYRHAGRGVEIVAARVELVGVTAPPERQTEGVRPRRPAPIEHRDVVFGGQRRATPIFDRSDLRAGDGIAGPAIIIDSFGIIVVEPGWDAEVTKRLDVVLRRKRASGAVAGVDYASPSVATEVDPIRLELFHNHFASIAEQMGATLQRTALSTNVKERLDFSCAVFDGAGHLVANAPHIPVHLGGMGATVRAAIERFGGFAPGDVVITNDPFEGGSHLPDVTVITPVHIGGEAVPRFFVANRAHHAEIGGKRPGSMAADATCLADEGVLIRPFKLFDAGRERFGALRALLTAGEHRSRQPDENIADVNAQVAANRRGVELLLTMVDRFGLDVVAAYMGHIRDASANMVRAMLGRLPAGVHERTEFLDDGTPIRVRVDVQSDRARVDFSGTGGVHPGNLNANLTIVRSAVLYCLRCLLADDIPLNDGVLVPVELVVPPGILNPPASEDPYACPAVGGGNVETSQRIVDAVFGALGVVAASQGTMNNVLIGNDRFGYYETIAGGAGAGPGFDGADAVHTHMTNTRCTDPEVFEMRYPMRLARFAIRRGSGGEGRFCGGDGVVREIEFLESVQVSILSQRRVSGPYGLGGGAPGARGRNRLHRRGAAGEELPPVTHFNAEPGDRLVVETPGGGGFGTE